MSTPLFKNEEQFKEYVAKLSPEEIQGWTSADWSNFHHKLRYMCDLKGIKPRDFVNHVCLPEFIKLYNNYRIDPEEFAFIQQNASTLGKELAQNDKIDVTQAIINNKGKCSDQMSIIWNTMKKNPQLSKKINEVEALGGKLNMAIDNNLDSLGAHSLKNGISVNLKKTKDDFVGTVAHESAHHLYWIDDYSYYTLDFYLESPSTESLLNITRHSEKSEIYTHFNAYKRQPVEKKAFLWGYFCERAYRKEAGRPSERGALNLIKLIGMPENMHYQDSRVVMQYSSEHKTKLSILSKLLPQQMSLKKNKDNTLSVSFVGDSYKANKLLYAINHSDNPDTALMGRFMKKSLKSVLQSKHTKRLAIALGLLIGSHAGTTLAKYIKQEMDFNAINKEWKMQYADADSVYADARTATFYAHKNLTPEQKEELSKQVDDLERKYLEENKGYDYSTYCVEQHIAYLRDKIAEGKEYVANGLDKKLKIGRTENNWTNMEEQEEAFKKGSHFKTEEEAWEKLLYGGRPYFSRTKE